ncbi:MAG: hypothetical protein HYW25_01015 [Candidatus Aenigmarchaeota archaeon]|nr:hypothetical protein [Candidatus Aenigmarchaeota archaeon]
MRLVKPSIHRVRGIPDAVFGGLPRVVPLRISGGRLVGILDELKYGRFLEEVIHIEAPDGDYYITCFGDVEDGYEGHEIERFEQSSRDIGEFPLGDGMVRIYEVQQLLVVRRGQGDKPIRLGEPYVTFDDGDPNYVFRPKADGNGRADEGSIHSGTYVPEGAGEVAGQAEAAARSGYAGRNGIPRLLRRLVHAGL